MIVANVMVVSEENETRILDVDVVVIVVVKAESEHTWKLKILRISDGWRYRLQLTPYRPLFRRWPFNKFDADTEKNSKQQ
jgi:hypothetical protein